jgi:hypothetical protein
MSGHNLATLETESDPETENPVERNGEPLLPALAITSKEPELTTVTTLHSL